MSARVDRRGFSLVEMVTAIALLSIVMGSLVGVLVSLQRDYTRQRDVNRSQETLRSAESAIVTVLRTARADPLETGGSLLDPDPLSHGAFDNVRVVSDYNPADGDFDDPLEDVQFWLEGRALKVRWQSGGDALTLAGPVETLGLEYFDSAGNALTAVSQIVDATRVRVTLVADKGPRSAVDDRLVSWVYLRN